MIKLVTPSEMQTILNETQASGLNRAQFVDEAAKSILHIIESDYGYLAESGAIGFIGGGLKGRITLATLVSMAQENWTATAYLLPQFTADDALLENFAGLGGMILRYDKQDNFKLLTNALGQCALWLDGIHEEDLSEDEVAIALLEHLTRFRSSLSMPVFNVAVDSPSGIDLSTGKVDPHTLAADKTIGIAALKTGLMCSQSLAMAGEIRLAEIEKIDQSKTYRSAARLVVNSDFTRAALNAIHKVTPANVCILGGSINQPGRILMAGQAALRSGAQQITLAAAVPLFECLAGHFPEAAWLILPHEMGVIAPAAAALLQKEAQPFTSLLIGAGIGSENTTKEFLGRLLDIPASMTKQKIGFVKSVTPDDSNKTHTALPALIIDNDGLALLSELPDWQARLPKDTILTLDARTLLRISGQDPEYLHTNWMETLERYAKEWNSVVIYLGYPIAIAAPQEGTAVISGNSIDFDKAGLGSLLAGIVAGLRGQGMPSFQAAGCGAWLFRQAATAAIEQVGSPSAFIASDAAAYLADIMLYLR